MKIGNSYFEDVIHWHKATGHPVRSMPSSYVGGDVAKSFNLGIKLIEEEYKELRSASRRGNYEDLADAAGDLIWVVCSLMIRMGIDLDGAWEEIRRTNWEKVGGPVREDGKTLKPEGWEPPDMTKALEGRDLTEILPVEEINSHEKEVQGHQAF